MTGAILAGGASRRLGQDKALVPLAGKPLAGRVAEVLASLVTEFWLVTNQPQAHLALGLPLVTDLAPWQGPLGGLYTALFFSRTPWVLVASVDNPLVSPSLLAALAARAGVTRRRAVLGASDRGLEPFPGLYAVGLLEALGAHLRQDRRLLPFVERVGPEVLSLPKAGADGLPDAGFFNLNTPADLEEARTRLALSPRETGPEKPDTEPPSGKKPSRLP